MFSHFLWNKNLFSRASVLKLSLVLLQITNYIYIFWYKGFVHWELKLLNLRMDSVLTRGWCFLSDVFAAVTSWLLKRDLTIRQRRRPWKVRWKIDFASFHFFSELFQGAQLLKRRKYGSELCSLQKHTFLLALLAAGDVSRGGTFPPAKRCQRQRAMRNGCFRRLGAMRLFGAWIRLKLMTPLLCGSSPTLSLFCPYV